MLRNPVHLVGLAVLLLGLLVVGRQPRLVSADQAFVVDPRALALSQSDLAADYQPDLTQSVFTDLPGGGKLTIAVFRRPADGSGPVMVRNTLNSLPDPTSASSYYARLPVILAQQGFAPAVNAPLGDDSAAYSAPDILDGKPVVYQTVAYRLESYVVLTTLVGPTSSTTVQQVAGLARLSYSKIAGSLGLPMPADVPIQPVVAAVAPPAPATTSPSIVRPATTPPGPPGILMQSALVNAPDLGTANLRLGGFSGLSALDKSGTLFMVVTDRGPNDELGNGKDRKMTFPNPTYSPSLLKVQVIDGQVQVLEQTPLRLRPGYTDSITGSDQISGLSTSERDGQPWSLGAREPLPYDPNGVDTEGLAWDARDGSFWICEEYGPSILHVASDGTIINRLVPRGLDMNSPGEAVRDILPRELAKRKDNRGFEGISLSPDRSTLFAIMQSPLSNPDEDAGEKSRNIRLITLDVSDSNNPRMKGMYLYLAESGDKVDSPQDDVKVGDIAALSSTRALVAERDNVEGGRHKMVYAIDISGATNLLDFKGHPKKTFEEMRASDLRGARIKTVNKDAVVDLARYGFRPEKLEGLAVVDEKTIAVTNDNDFGFAGFDGSDQAIPSGNDSKIVLVRLDKSLPMR